MALWHIGNKLLLRINMHYITSNPQPPLGDVPTGNHGSSSTGYFL